MISSESMGRLLRNKNLYVMLAGEGALFCLAWIVAYLLRFEFDIPTEYARQMYGFLPLAVGLKLGFFLMHGLYRGMWRYTSISDLVNIIKATVISAGAIALTLLDAKA